LAEEKGLELLCDIAPSVPEFVQADSARIRQVVVNLLSNAIKFTATGEVSFSVRVVKEMPDCFVLQCTIADTGIGVPLEQRHAIFSPFTQADTSTTRR